MASSPDVSHGVVLSAFTGIPVRCSIFMGVEL